MDALMTKQVADAILSRIMDVQNAEIFKASTELPFGVQVVTLNLGTARSEDDPFIIAFPFKSLYVENATDVASEVNCKLNIRDKHQSPVRLKLNDSIETDRMFGSAYLYWDAQASKQMTIVFFVDARFRSGSQISQTGGGVAIITGSSSEYRTEALSAATTTQLFSTDTTRQSGTVWNGTGATLWIGSDSSVNNTTGIPYAAGERFIWTNTGPLYAYSVAGGDVRILEEFT